MEKPIKKNSAKSRVSKPSVKKNPAKRENKSVHNVKNTDYRPSDDEIRELANELYQSRLNMGEYGTELDDWFHAEMILRSRKFDEQVA